MAETAHRFNFRVLPYAEERLRAAAEISHESLTDFVLGAAALRADEVLATKTLVASDYFDRLVDALNEPPIAMAELAVVAKREMRYVQR